MKLQDQMFAHVEAQRAGKGTISAYCAEHRMSYAKFHYWCKRYDESERASAFDAAFVQLRPSGQSRVSLSLELPDGSRLVGSAEQLAGFYRQSIGV